MTKYTHTNIVARNWKRIADFYVTVFDCRIKPPERDYSGDWLDQATGLTKAVLKGAHLLLPGFGENGPTLEIFNYEDLIEKEPLMANCTGFTHIAFEVKDVEKTFQFALQHGATELGKVTKRKVEGIGLLTFVYLRDPEGNIIEIQSWQTEEG